MEDGFGYCAERLIAPGNLMPEEDIKGVIGFIGTKERRFIETS